MVLTVGGVTVPLPWPLSKNWVVLPEVSGFELLGEWRASPRTADLAVFILTSMDLTQEEQSYLRTHAESLFNKQEPWQGALLKQLERVVSLGTPEKV